MANEFIGLFAVGDPARELQGIAEEMLLPVAIGTLAAWIIVRLWAKNVQWQSRFAVSVAFGTLLAAVLSLVILTSYITIQDNAFTVSTIAFKAALLSIFFLPTLLILGPIVVGCLIRARRGQTLLSSFALYGVSVFCIVLQYFWMAYFLSG
jgi:hypothetical protein